MSIATTERVAVAPIDAQVTLHRRISDVRSHQRGCSYTRMPRPRVHGKFLFVADEKFWVRGVTYGTFKPDAAGTDFPPQDIVERDFDAMAEAGLNSIRVYTPPPLWLLDAAAARGLRVMIGLPWEQHVAFLDDAHRAERIIADQRRSVRQLAGHSGILCFAVGNEIPPSVVRWYGKARIERFIWRLCVAIKSEDPTALVTYVNFPTTEYLELPFLDFLAFNVYLESKERLASYLARLQNLAGERPLVMAELGLDSRRNGEARQAEVLDWQIAAAFESGCAGAFVFAWTDEWFRGGTEITDWDFGLTMRDRRPKQALVTVAARFADVPFATGSSWPKVSVVVCSYNGSRTIGQTLAALEELEYPDYEIIVVDDGSTDRTAAIAGQYRARVIRTQNNGLSAARNRGMHEATGEIIAYIDDDAYPDAQWLTYLAACFMRTKHAGIGGPNISPPGDGLIADCVANAPGGPVHVLLTDEVAEHIPGCNMAYRRGHLMAVGGFDPVFRVAGDDVDVCWQLQERGWSLGFASAAVVWHHRRNSIRTYFRQQRGYAKAEALLADKWPNKYNGFGHLTWCGRLYGKGLLAGLFERSRIYHGRWGSAPFQSLYQPGPDRWLSSTLMPEWYALLLFLAGLTSLGASWLPLLGFAPLLGVGVALTVMQAARGAYRASFHPSPSSKLRGAAMRFLVGIFHLVQPVARLVGRVQHGIGPWNWRGFCRLMPLPNEQCFWSERWEAIETRISGLQALLKNAGVATLPGGDFDAWDLSVRGGLFGEIRLVAMVEEHAQGRQLCRFRAWPKPPVAALAILVVLSALSWFAMEDRAWFAGVSLGIAAGMLGIFIYADCALATNRWRGAFDQYLRLHPETKPIKVPGGRSVWRSRRPM